MARRARDTRDVCRILGCKHWRFNINFSVLMRLCILVVTIDTKLTGIVVGRIFALHGRPYPLFTFRFVLIWFQVLIPKLAESITASTHEKLVTTRDLASISPNPSLFSLVCLRFVLYAQNNYIPIKAGSNVTHVKVWFITIIG